MTMKVFFKGGVLFATLVLVVVLLKVSGLDATLDEAWVDKFVTGQGVTGFLVFVFVGALFTAVGLPRQLVGFLGGYAFGIAEGTAVAVFASALGCGAAFFYARFLGRDLVQTKFPDRVRKIDDFLADNPFTMTLVIRFMPFGSNLVTNLIAGVSSVSALIFVAASAIGYIPQTLIFAVIGAGIKVDPTVNITLAIVLFLVSGSLGLYLYRRYRRGKSLGEDIA